MKKDTFPLYGQFLPEPDSRGMTLPSQVDQIEPSSAGVNPKGIDPKAIKVMAETEIDISGSQLKTRTP